MTNRIDITSITGIHTGEAFQSFVNITMLTLSDKGWKARFSKWTHYDQYYLDYVKRQVEGVFWAHFHSEDLMPDEHRIELCQDIFQSLYGLCVYKAWGAWAEGYFDNFAKRVRDYNVELYKLSEEFGSDSEPVDVYNELPFEEEIFHDTYLGSLGKLPYQVWQRFFVEFKEWLYTKYEPVCYRELLKEVVLPNDEYREYFKNHLRKDLLKVLLKKIDLRNQDIKEVYHV